MARSGTGDGGTDTVGESQGANGRIVNLSAILERGVVQVQVPAELRADVSAHRFWKRGTTAVFDIQIVNFDAGSYLCMTPEKAHAMAEKETKYLYLQAYLECRRDFTPMVYFADGIPIVEALAAQTRLAALISYKLKREYSEMCGFVSSRVSLAIVMSNSLLRCGPHDKRVRIRQRPELTGEAMMSLLYPWRS